MEVATVGKIVIDKKFSSISTTYDWIASIVHNSTSNLLKEELKKVMKNMGAQLF